MKLALGTVQFGMEYGIQKNGKPRIKDAIDIMDTAVNYGVRVLDTAAAYGYAEKIIGAYLRCGEVRRDTLSIITKVRPNAFQGIDANRYQHVLAQESAASMARIHTDYLDGLLYHNAQYVFDPYAMEALVKQRCKGHINSVGISVYTPKEAAAALQYDLDIVQVPYNVYDRRLDSTAFFETASARGIMIVARSVLLQGLLTMPEVPEKLPVAAPYVKNFRETCDQLHLSPLEGAVGFAVRHPDIDCLLFGVDSKRQLGEVLSAARKKMDDGAYRILCRSFAHVPECVFMPQLWPREV